MAFPASSSRFMHSSTYTVSATSTSRSTNQPKIRPPLPSQIQIQKNSTSNIPPITSAALGSSFMPRNTSRMKAHSRFSICQHQARSRKQTQLFSTVCSFSRTARLMHHQRDRTTPAAPTRP